MNIEVICLEEPAFFELIERVVKRLESQHQDDTDKWISPEVAMQKLNITSKATLQKLRDEGKIRYSQRGKKLILYDKNSISNYLDQNAKNTF